MHHDIGAVVGKHPVQRRTIPDIDLLEAIERRLRHHRHILEIGRIGQAIEVHHLMTPRNRQPHHGRSDEAGTAGDKKFHVTLNSCLNFP